MTNGSQRRKLLSGLVALTSLGGTVGILDIQMSTDGLSWGETVLAGLYALLLVWISAGFWLFVVGAISGFRHQVAASAEIMEKPRGHSRTVVVIPIYHEDAETVFNRVRVIYRSLARTGHLDGFEFFILSDSRDFDAGRAEMRAWQNACRDLSAAGRLFYRRRPDNRGRKSGNIEEFCRRWGGRYSYMVVLDADSLITGHTLVSMVARMQADPRMAILQTWPVSIGGQSLFSRLQQFAGSVYGRLFVAGLTWIQMGAGTYWGHNAIIRVKAFADHCALPHLPGRKPLGGEILSHDFVEAALLLKAGWRVCLAPDLSGSYEEGVPNLIEHARRDRRWCQGNLQHWRLLFARGMHAMSRATFLIGIMSYLSGLLWLAFLALSILTFPGDFAGWLWPETSPSRLPGLLLIAMTATLLFAPKILGLGLILADPTARRDHGGAMRLALSVVVEAFFSALIAPLLAVLHARFVCSVLAGRDSGWGPPQRGVAEVSWRSAFASHGIEMAVGLVLGGMAAFLAPGLFWWLLPITMPLLLAAPISVLTGRTGWGRTLQRLGLLLTPTEVHKTAEIREFENLNAALRDIRVVHAPAAPTVPASYNSVERTLLPVGPRT
ncbi:MAG: glucans biosynthesis glucosyltransferase MdoH [Rhodospirillales bacterium]|jgi:membrane glycosyltransferase|nr:glucans biosynthesis glucosyltransferase MdoH [Rhodospirillales bacterium]